MLLSDITEASIVKPAPVTSGIGRTLLNQTSEVPKTGSIAWAPCSCCQGSAAECDKSAEEVLAPSLLQLDIQVVLDFGCLSLAQFSEERVLKYPALDEGRRLQASQPPSQRRFGKAMLNQVCALTLNIFQILAYMALQNGCDRFLQLATDFEQMILGSAHLLDGMSLSMVHLHSLF